MSQGILFCTPAYGGLVTSPHWNSCLQLKAEMMNAGMNHGWLTGKNESLVHRARMEMTAGFLESEFSHQMWIDADIEFTPDDVAKLWNLQTDIAVAAYSMKRDDMPLSAWKDGKLVKLDECPAEPFEVDYAGTGFMLISRAAIERVYEHKKAFERKAKALVASLCVGLPEEDQHVMRRLLEGAASSYKGPQGRTPALYMTPIHNDGLESEDYHFCRVAREAGMKVIMDPSIRLGHIGQFRYG